jgi:hypothetical protein
VEGELEGKGWVVDALKQATLLLRQLLDCHSFGSPQMKTS